MNAGKGGEEFRQPSNEDHNADVRLFVTDIEHEISRVGTNARTLFLRTTLLTISEPIDDQPAE
jgi:hypothetical protein